MHRRILITVIPRGLASFEGEDEGIHSSGAVEAYQVGSSDLREAEGMILVEERIFSSCDDDVNDGMVIPSSKDDSHGDKEVESRRYTRRAFGDSMIFSYIRGADEIHSVQQDMDSNCLVRSTGSSEIGVGVWLSPLEW